MRTPHYGMKCLPCYSPKAKNLKTYQVLIDSLLDGRLHIFHLCSFLRKKGHEIKIVILNDVYNI